MFSASGLCKCGCGGETKIASRNDYRDGSIKGKPVSYIRGHHRRKSYVEYTVKDCGYKTPCWVWLKATSTRGQNGGYGRMYDDGKMRSSHIVYYERKYGKVPADRRLDHLCRVRNCVNPDHLEPVTDAENVQRGNNAVLSSEEVMAIRHNVMGHTKRQLATIYGVSVSNIKMILLGKTWKNIA